MQPKTSRLLTTEEAATILGLQAQTLAAWRCKKRYDLKYIRVGRLIRYRESDLIDFMDRCANGQA